MNLITSAPVPTNALHETGGEELHHPQPSVTHASSVTAGVCAAKPSNAGDGDVSTANASGDGGAEAPVVGEVEDLLGEGKRKDDSYVENPKTKVQVRQTSLCDEFLKLDRLAEDLLKDDLMKVALLRDVSPTKPLL